jgi:hypothetical protein
MIFSSRATAGILKFLRSRLMDTVPGKGRGFDVDSMSGDLDSDTEEDGIIPAGGSDRFDIDMTLRVRRMK